MRNLFLNMTIFNVWSFLMKFQGFVDFFPKMLTQVHPTPSAVTREKKAFRVVCCPPSLPGIEPAPIRLPIDLTN